MPRPHPPQFREKAVELARERAKPIAVLARDLGISDSCLRNWMAQADIEAGDREHLTRAERDEMVRLRRETRVLRMEKAILGQAAAFFSPPTRSSTDLCVSWWRRRRPTTR